MREFEETMKSLKQTAYHQWVKSEGLPMIEALALEDVRTAQLHPWRRTGGKGAFIHLYGMEGVTGMYVGEIPSGGALEPEKHLYEEVIFVFEGNGATEVWQEGQKKQMFEWGKWSLFAPPLNAWHRLINGGREPVKFLAVTDAPMIMDLYRNDRFVFDCPFTFGERYAGEDTYFNVGSKRYKKGIANVWETNFISDIGSADLEMEEEKGAGVLITCFEISGNSLIGHISQWPAGRYHKAHYHGPGAMLIGLQSKGYVLLWPKEFGLRPYQEGHEDKVIEQRWGEGAIYCPPGGWFHQHFNTGNRSARHLAIRFGSRVNPTGFFSAAKRYDDGVVVPIKQGGTMIDYEDEDPEIRRRFETILRKEGVAFTMPPVTYV
jgi:oxalate decarboxylase/phosphoglucose isomerase-like protein (cupin superfamily)